MKQILLMIAVVALVGCGKKDPVQPSATNPEATKPEKEKGKEATQPITPNPERLKELSDRMKIGHDRRDAQYPANRETKEPEPPVWR